MEQQPRFSRRFGLLLPAVLGPVLETVLLRAFAPGSAALAPQVTAPPPFDLFHDLRWVSVYHDSWWTLAMELWAVLVIRSVWMAWVVRRSWPRGAGSPLPLLAAARRVSLFYAVAMVLFVPWVVLLFGLAFSHLSFLFFAAIPPAVALALVLHRGAVSRAASLPGWRPTWRSAAWILAAFLWLTVGGGVVASASLPLAVLAAGAIGVLNARATFGVVQDLALGRQRRPLRALTPALVAAVFAATVGGSAIGFAVTMGHHDRFSPLRPVPTARVGDHPVLIAAGLHSRYDPRSPLDLPHGYVGWRYSYRGIDARGRPLPYGPGDTQHSLGVSARRMAEQVDALHRAYDEPVTIVAESEGALVARSYLVERYRPSTHAVNRLITLDMPSGVSSVYFPPRGLEGWGVASGWGLRGLTTFLGSIAPLRLSVDSALGREFTDCRNLLARVATSPPPPGVQEVSFQALADWVDPPAEVAPGIQTYFVNAPHGGMMGRVPVRKLIRSILAGAASQPAATRTGWLALLVRASARPWEVPSLPLTLGSSTPCRRS